MSLRVPTTVGGCAPRFAAEAEARNPDVWAVRSSSARTLSRQQREEYEKAITINRTSLQAGDRVQLFVQHSAFRIRAAYGVARRLPSGWGAEACTIAFALTRTPIFMGVRGCGTSV